MFVCEGHNWKQQDGSFKTNKYDKYWEIKEELCSDTLQFYCEHVAPLSSAAPQIFVFCNGPSPFIQVHMAAFGTALILPADSVKALV